jgi:hypothetical protein
MSVYSEVWWAIRTKKVGGLAPDDGGASEVCVPRFSGKPDWAGGHEAPGSRPLHGHSRNGQDNGWYSSQLAYPDPGHIGQDQDPFRFGAGPRLGFSLTVVRHHGNRKASGRSQNHGCPPRATCTL